MSLLQSLESLKDKLLIPNNNKVRYFYVVPSDKIDVASGEIQRAALHHQSWYQWRLGNEKTFTLHNPIVEVIKAPHTSAWFNENPNGQSNSWYFNNARLAVVEKIGAHSSSDVWMVYTDSQPVSGQKMGGVTRGAVMGAEDILGLQGKHPKRTLCRQIGGDAHELGHTFDLHHPDSKDPDYPRALMGTGYGIYPNCLLRQADLDTLNKSLFFSIMWNRRPPAGLCVFDQRVKPAPRPPPTPRGSI